jgi:hypothetical protein
MDHEQRWKRIGTDNILKKEEGDPATASFPKRCIPAGNALSNRTETQINE